MKDIIAFDTETTGLDTKNDYIIQLSACKLDGATLNIKDKRNYIIVPQHKFTISPGALKTHGYTEEFIKENGKDGMEGIFSTNIFGKTIEQIVTDGIRTKIDKLSDETQTKMQETLQKITNDSHGGVICIII